MTADTEEERVVAAVDLIGRCGATQVQVGYLRDGVPADEAGWWAKAELSGVTVRQVEHLGPGSALEALAVQLMDGGMCVHCRGEITLNPLLANSNRCLWSRHGNKWKEGCR